MRSTKRATEPSEIDERKLLAHALNRRRFLALLGGAGAAGAVGCSPNRRASLSPLDLDAATVQAVDESLPVSSSATQAQQSRPADARRRLIVIEMSGGNDGLAMLQPFESGVLRDARSALVAPDEELIDAGSGFGWHPNLAGLAGVGIGAAVGIGSNAPDFSHFEMEQRWWSGVSENNSRVGTGFFGRLCDQLDVGELVTGLSLAGGPTPALASEKAVTVGLTDPGASWFFSQDEPWYDMLRSTYGAMAQPSPADDDRFVAARSGLSDTLRFASALAEIPDGDNELYPWTDLGQQLRFAAEVIDLDVGVRVMHVRQGGFDTHAGQQWRHAELMTELNDATVAFVGDMASRGLLEDTMIVTTSEFGRRVPDNNSGTDHGGASTMMVCSPSSRAALGGGVHGQSPNLGKLDDGNMLATARFEDYYASIADDWFSVDPQTVLPTGGSSITGLV